MTTRDRGMRIALVGHYGAGNIGDEATIEALIKALRDRLPDATIVGVSANPADTRRRHGIDSFPVRRYYGTQESAQMAGKADGPVRPAPATGGRLRLLLKRLPFLRSVALALRAIVRFFVGALPGEIAFATRSYRFLRGFDIVLIAGSGQFNDEWYGPWAFPYTLARWAAIARLAGTRLAIVSVGAGPIGSRLSAFFYRLCLSLAEYRSFRDEFSLDLLRRHGYRGVCRVYPDLAHGLGRPRALAEVRPISGRVPVIGINAMPVMDERYWHSDDPTRAARYREALTAVARRLLAMGWDVFFFPSQPKDMEVIGDIVAGSGGGEAERAKRVRFVDTVDKALEVMRSTDVIVATRFHAAVLPMAICTPAIAISYNPKTIEAMRQMGAGEWTVDFNEINAEAVITKIRNLVSRIDEERERLVRMGDAQRKALDEQYDRVLEQLTGRPMHKPKRDRDRRTAEAELVQ